MADESKPRVSTAGSTADAAAAAPPADAPPEAPKLTRREWKQHLDESNAWQALSQDTDLRYTRDEIRGGDELERAQAGRLLSLATNILAAHGFVVDGEYDPRLTVRVSEA